MKTWVSLVTAMLLLITGLVVTAPAEVVGHLTLVEGRVDLLKGGQLPANPAKPEDPVELGDVLRTKSLSKAVITFVDNTVITISPESRIAVEAYMFDPANGKRNAVLELFQGMALAVVSKIFKAEQPDFVIKTHTAIMGVRGTEVGVRLSPNDSTFLNFQGLTRVASVFPEISGDLFRKAAKVALSFGKGYVDLHDWQGTTVGRNLPPTMAYGLTKEDREIFLRQMVVSTVGPQGSGGGKTSSGVCSPTAGTCTTNSLASSSSSTTAAANAALDSGTTGGLNAGIGVQVIPVLLQTTVTPVSTVASIVNLAFTPTFLSPVSGSTGLNNSLSTAKFNISGPISGNFNLSSPAISPSFQLSGFSFTAGISTPNYRWTPSVVNGTPVLNWNWQGAPLGTSAQSTLSGPTGGTLSGTMNLTITIGNQNFTLQGPITYSNGNLTFNSLSGTFTTNGGLPIGTVTSGSPTQLVTASTITPALSTAAPQAGTAVKSSNLGLLAGTRIGAQQGLPLRK